MKQITLFILLIATSLVSCSSDDDTLNTDNIFTKYPSLNDKDTLMALEGIDIALEWDHPNTRTTGAIPETSTGTELDLVHRFTVDDEVLNTGLSYELIGADNNITVQVRDAILNNGIAEFDENYFESGEEYFPSEGYPFSVLVEPLKVISTASGVYNFSIKLTTSTNETTTLDYRVVIN